ncbi:MAG: [Fe-Fe] hydrogenase large subunit C-terminal domain-containing protein [Bacteroidota bacterium]
MLIDIEVNNNIIKARKEETILSALRRNGLSVPTLCHMKELLPTGACRLCAVEIEGFPGLIPACSYPVNEWMRIKTHSPRVVKARKTIVELLLSNHPDDCLYCIRNGNCELQHLAEELNVHDRRFFGSKKKQKIDNSSPAIIREPDKCILCGRCVRVCNELLDVSAIEFIRRGTHATIGPEFNKGINTSTCINCGQCIMHCPTAALHEKTSFNSVSKALHQPEKHVIAITDTAIGVSLAEEFGLKPGKDLSGLLNTTLRAIGFDAVYDTAFGADMYISELVQELTERKKQGISRPLLTNHCPAWIRHAEQTNTELLKDVTTTLPPQQQLAKILKTYYADKKNIKPSDVFVVSLNTCTAKKEEITRKAYFTENNPNIHVSMTTRETADFIKLHGIDIHQLEEELSDLPFGMASAAGKMHPLSGGITESLSRSLFFSLKQRELRPARISKLRNTKTIKEYTFTESKKPLHFVAVNGIKEAMQVINEVESGTRKADFIEILACKNGCVGGGGQPLRQPEENLKARRKALYDADNKGSIKLAEKNPELEELTERFLGLPGSEKRKSLLHIS